MAKYRAKAETFYAEQFDGTLECAARLVKMYPDQIGLVVDRDGVFLNQILVNVGISAYTTKAGDWLYCTQTSRLYTCSNDVFTNTYEPISEPAEPARITVTLVTNGAGIVQDWSHSDCSIDPMGKHLDHWLACEKRSGRSWRTDSVDYAFFPGSPGYVYQLSR